MEKSFLDRMTEIVGENLGNSLFGAEDLARKMGVSHSGLLRKARSLTGKTVNQFIREMRLQKALELLREEELTASEVAFLTGFGSAAYFSNCFSEHFGFTPGEAKNRQERKSVEEVEKVKEVKDFTGFTDGGVGGRRYLKQVVMMAAVAVIVLLAGFLVLFQVKRSKEEIRIAVLPFRNLSLDTTQQWFCDGFKEELLNKLSGISRFSVISRISSDQYRDTKKTVKTIGKELDVDYLLEGSVGRSGGKIKAWLQLIDAKGDEHVWTSDTIWKGEDEQFDIQIELAVKIAGQLRTVLSPEETRKIETKPTENAEAYNSFLKANYYDADGLMNSNLAIRLYEKAIESDPGFTLAYSRLARCWLFRYFNYENRDQEVLLKCKKLIDKVFELDPDLPEAHVTLGIYYYRALLRYDDAMREVEIALKQQPNDGDALWWYGAICRRAGKWDLATEYMVKGFRQNPRSAGQALQLGAHYGLIGDKPKAEYYFNRAIQIRPNAANSYIWFANFLLDSEGPTEKFRKLLEDAALNIPSIVKVNSFMTQKFAACLYNGNYQQALRELDSMSPKPYEDQQMIRTKSFFLATAYGCLKDSAMESLYWDSERVFLEKRLAAKPDDPRIHSALGKVYAGLHLDKQAIESGLRALDYLPVDMDAISGAFYKKILAEIYVKTGHYKEALELLSYLFTLPGGLSTIELELHPKWAPLRDIPEFRKLLKKYAVKSR